MSAPEANPTGLNTWFRIDDVQRVSSDGGQCVTTPKYVDSCLRRKSWLLFLALGAQRVEIGREFAVHRQLLR